LVAGGWVVAERIALEGVTRKGVGFTTFENFWELASIRKTKCRWRDSREPAEKEKEYTLEGSTTP